MFEIETNIVLETERLRLRFMESSYRKAIFELIAHDKEVLRYFVMDYCETEQELNLERMIERYAKSSRYFLAVTDKESGNVMGMLLMCSSPSPVMNSCEIGCALGRTYQGKGYASEATQALIEQLFRQGVHKVTACHILENEASKKCLQSIMRFEGIRKDELYYHGKYHDVGNYYLINPND